MRKASSAAEIKFQAEAERVRKLLYQDDYGFVDGTNDTPYNRRHQAFKRAAYHLIRTTASRSGGLPMMKGLVESTSRENKGKTRRWDGDKNPFFNGLSAVVPYDCKIFTRKKRSLFSLQMLYADRHNVPPCLLTGFLMQSGIMNKISVERAICGNEAWDVAEYQLLLEDGVTSLPTKLRR